MTESAPKLFISYRREETPSHAGRLYDAMAARFGERNVFMDIELEPGIDFIDRIAEVLSACHVFLVVVGPTWATLSNGGSRPRISDREDYVRLEVETALRRRDVRVIPLLVAGARMPHAEELPEELRALTRRNALELSDMRWRYDVGRLMGTLERLLETGAMPVSAGAKGIEGRPPRAPAEVKVGHIKGSRPEIDVGAQIAGHRLEAVIGRGGMGVVYRARDLRLDCVVALKVIAPEFAEEPDFRQRFKRESLQAASIRHPNVISIYRVGEEGHLLFITMEYVEGTDLKTFIGVRGRLDPRLAAGVVSQVAAGLEAAHARGLVHRDVKPANVLIERQERAYLTDFGLTKRAAPGSALTTPGLIAGTTDCLAPEQIQGDKLNARVDVYALGCVLYEALTGFVPYPRESAAATMRAHISDPPPSVLDRAPDVPMEFDVVVRRAMAKEPTQRFISAQAMGRALDAAARGGASWRGTGVLPKTASEPGHVEPKTEVASQGLAPRTPADTQVTSQGTAGTGEDPRHTRPEFPATTPAITEIGPGTDAATGAPTWLRRNPRMLFALAGLGLALVIAAVLLVTSGGGGEDRSTSNGSASVPAATKLPADLDWSAIRDAPFVRQYAASTAVDGKVWVFGGLARKWSSTATKVYDPAEATWRTGPGLPLPLHHLMAVTYKRKAVVMGGFVPGDELDSEQSDRVFALPEGGTWEEMPRLHHPRAAAAAAVVGDKIVVVGGQADGKLVAQSEMFDGERWRDVAEIPTPREHLGAASDGRYVYAVGGRELSSAQNVRALERYDPVSDSWKKLENMPTASGSVGAAYVGGRLITVGGESATSASDAVQAFDIQKQAWSSRLPNLPHARHGVAVTVLNDSLYAVGGAAVPGHYDSTNDAAVLDLSGTPAAVPTTADLDWRDIHDAPFPRQYAASTALGGRVLLVGGIGKGETPTADTAAYDGTLDFWTRLPALPRPLHHLMAVTYEGEAVVMGGFVPAGERVLEESDRVFALRDEEWEELPRLHHRRAAAAAAVVGDKIVVVGGQADGKLVAQSEVFDGERWTDVAEIPTPRDHLGAASDGRYLYAVGGRELSQEKNLRALERYDPVSDSWKSLTRMPTASGSVGAAYVGGRLITVGGESTMSASDDVQAFDIQKQTWSRLPNLPHARHGVAVTVLNDSLYAVGGAAIPGHVQSTREAEVLDFD
jgi:serine/threonine protein kinase/N-acetylneuraminic acid mutarotase